jgi:hypothetical protein
MMWDLIAYNKLNCVFLCSKKCLVYVMLHNKVAHETPLVRSVIV